MKWHLQALGNVKITDYKGLNSEEKTVALGTTKTMKESELNSIQFDTTPRQEQYSITFYIYHARPPHSECVIQRTSARLRQTQMDRRYLAIYIHLPLAWSSSV